MQQLAGTLLTFLVDALRYLGLCLRPPVALAAENLLLRKQLALYQERKVKPKRATTATRLAVTVLSRWFDWRQALVIVQPQTLIRWQRQGFWLFWCWQSSAGRPRLPAGLRTRIRRMARENPTWGEERIANARWLEPGLRVSPRTVRTYRPKPLDDGRGQRTPSPGGQTLVRHHAQALVACDVGVVRTATLRCLSVCGGMAHATRRMLPAHVTAPPTAPWPLQRRREASPAAHVSRFLRHDREAIFSQERDRRGRHLGVKVLKTPPQSPQATALGERLRGPLRREGLDVLIALRAHHLRGLVRAWVPHDHAARPQTALGPGMPQPPPPGRALWHASRHRLPGHLRVAARPLLGGVHQE